MRPALKKLRNKHNLVGAEIGVFHGNYALIYLKDLDIKKVVLIDPYKEYENYDRYTSEALSGAKKDAHEKLNIYVDKITWIELMSAEAVELIDFESLDFVYIDGNHGYQPVLQDVTLYYPKVKTGGLVSGHDYRSVVRNNVADAIDEFCKNHNLKHHVDIQSTDWWFWK